MSLQLEGELEWRGYQERLARWQSEVEIYPDRLVLEVRVRELAREWKVRYSWWSGMELGEVDALIADLAVGLGLMYITS